jgi:hypothetical protein
VVVRLEKGNGRELRSFISHFSSPACSVIQEFNLVINPDAEPEFRGLLAELREASQGIPINHYVNAPAEADTRMHLVPGSKAQLLYLTSLFINDEPCQDLQEYLALANLRAVSGLLGLVGEVESSTTIQTDLTRKEPEIFYYDKIEGNHYSLVEDIRLLPRHFLELLHSPIP